ncbi:MAG: hypothetical protein Q4C47_07595, partial [Planctomycetia bacterium]|nr:hypothetical protein [Planctomycetia bacterium]
MRIPSAFTPGTLRIARLLRDGGALDVYAVGGSVRDALLGLHSKDIDLEVRGLSYQKIADILSPHFPVSFVGRSFGVLKVGHHVDVSLPRRESKIGSGHRGFAIEADPTLSEREAFARRDFTVNAIGMRPDGTLIDHYDGLSDLKRGILRAVSPAFRDDPLRVLRGMQFAARFGFTMDEGTVNLCRELFDEFPTLSEERILEEWRKWALRGRFPSRGLAVLRQTGWIRGFPELAALCGCPAESGSQKSCGDSGGDVWDHTCQVCDRMTRLV